MKTRRKAFARRIFAVVIFVIICLMFFLSITNGQEMYDRASFSQKICENLVVSGYLEHENCYTSSSVPDVMNALFPLGTDITKVQTAMDGFELLSPASGSSPSCKEWVSFEYLIIHRWALLFDESFEFVFCNGTLISKGWHE